MISTHFDFAYCMMLGADGQSPRSVGASQHIAISYLRHLSLSNGHRTAMPNVVNG